MTTEERRSWSLRILLACRLVSYATTVMDSATVRKAPQAQFDHRSETADLGVRSRNS